MKKIMNRILVTVIILTSLFGNTTAYASNTFKVSANAKTVFVDTEHNWANNYIQRISNVNIVNGYPDGSYRPKNDMSRAEFITVLVRAIGWDVPDTDYSKWYEKYMEVAKNKGILKDSLMEIYNHPLKKITRYETAHLLHNLVMIELDTSNTFWSNPSYTDIATDSILITTYTYGIFEGYSDSTFRPSENISRAEVATIFSNMYFGNRGDNDVITKLPIFYTYEYLFTDAEKEKINRLKNPKLAFEEPDKGEFKVIGTLSEFVSQIHAESDCIVADLRSVNEFNAKRLVNAANYTPQSLVSIHKTNKTLFVYNTAMLSDEAVTSLIEKFTKVYFYRVDSAFADAKDTSIVIGTSVKEKIKDSDIGILSNVPEELTKRFERIRKDYKLTWTDKDFKNWWENATPEELDEVLAEEWRRTPFIIDFEKKTVLVANKYNKLKERTFIDPNEFSALQVENMGYLLYEYVKMNTEYMLNDGEDWGCIEIYRINEVDVSSNGVFADINDEIGNSVREHYSLLVYGDDYYNSYSKVNRVFSYTLYDMFDYQYFLDDVENGKYIGTGYDSYVQNNVKMNMLLFHGYEQGQAVYDNYLLAYKRRSFVDSSEPNALFDGKVGNLYVNHMKPNDYLIIYTKEEFKDAEY